MKLYKSLALLLLAGNANADINGTNTEKACDDESGYEVWQSLPPEDAKVKFEGHVDCDAETYTLIYSFEPDMVRDLLLTVKIRPLARWRPSGAGGGHPKRDSFSAHLLSFASKMLSHGSPHFSFAYVNSHRFAMTEPSLHQ